MYLWVMKSFCLVERGEALKSGAAGLLFLQNSIIDRALPEMKL